jgi:hypothetical protein
VTVARVATSIFKDRRGVSKYGYCDENNGYAKDAQYYKRMNEENQTMNKNGYSIVFNKEWASQSVRTFVEAEFKYIQIGTDQSLNTNLLQEEGAKTKPAVPLMPVSSQAKKTAETDNNII